jgi:hypothetical protein
VNSLLTLLQHERSPSEETAAFAVNYLDRMIGSILDFSTIQSGRPGEEKNAVDVRELWEHLGAFGPSPECSGSFPDRRGSLTSPAWSAVTESHGTIEDSERSGGETVSARVDLWPMLKRAGFSEFTDRLAHRISDDLVEVVEFLPMDPYERKASNHPPGLFRIGLGLFWNDLREDGLFRRDRVGNPRPIANECHISNWLTPSKHIDQPARTAFDSAQDAGAALSEEGLAWLGLLRDASSAESMLGRANWELFFCFPMMRGYGAKRSPRRLTYLAQFARKLGQIDRAENYLAAAEAVIDTWYVEHFRSKYRSWIAGIRERWAAI